MTQNQCDGCVAGKPLVFEKYHRMGDGEYSDLMYCQREKYLATHHTPLPWQQFDDGGTSGNVTYGKDYAAVLWGPQGPGFGLVADFRQSGIPNEERVANAKFVARAVNSYDDLVVELERYHGLLFSDYSHSGWDGCGCDTAVLLRKIKRSAE